jgi:hypothetical protein
VSHPATAKDEERHNPGYRRGFSLFRSIEIRGIRCVDAAQRDEARRQMTRQAGGMGMQCGKPPRGSAGLS